MKKAPEKANVYGVEVPFSDHWYVREIADLLYARSEFSYAEKGRKDVRGLARKKLARIALKALEEAKKL
jgi:hypothetical protein